MEREETKKIVFHIYNLNRGGAERVVVNLSEQFARDGYEVLIVTEEYAECEYEVPVGVRRIHAGVVNKENPGVIARFLDIKKRQNNLRKVLKAEQPDLVIAFGRSANYRAVPAAKGICPVMVSVRNDPKVHYASRMHRIFCKKYLYHADGCVFQTEEAKAFFPAEFTQNSRIILNPIHEKYLNLTPSEKRRPVIVNVGRIMPQKNQELLICAFIKVAEKFPEYQLHLYGADSGDGTKEQLEAIIHTEEMAGRVRFCGNSDRLQEEINDCALFVLSSDYEGLPNALMEAMAMGLPVISTDCPCGGPAVLIEDGINGHLVPVGDVEAMAQAIEKVLSDEEHARQMGKEASKICERANGEVIYRQWKEYAEELICSSMKSV